MDEESGTDGIALLEGDALAVLRTLPDASVQCCVTSPPYWLLRSYGHDGQMGAEPTPEAYVAGMVAVFREVKRVLRDDATLWLNIGDSYASTTIGSVRPKDLVGIPWMVAFALRADGWYLRSEIIWSKSNPMPESVRDRPTKSHEYIFLLSKSARYYFDADAVSEPAIYGTDLGLLRGRNFDDPKNVAWHAKSISDRQSAGVDSRAGNPSGTRNIRSVWSMATEPSPLPHFAAFPEELPRRCIKAGSAVGDTILDPFAGTGTTLKVARDLGRKAIGIELSPEYVQLATDRLTYGVRGTMAIRKGQLTL